MYSNKFQTYKISDSKWKGKSLKNYKNSSLFKVNLSRILSGYFVWKQKNYLTIMKLKKIYTVY